MNQTSPRCTRLCLALALAPSLALAQLASPAQPTAQAVANDSPLAVLTVQTSFSDQPVAPNATITLTFSQPLPDAGRWVLMVGTEDVTAQFRLRNSHTLEGDFSKAALPSGQHMLKVYANSGMADGQLLAQLPLTVQATEGGAQQAQYKPGAVLGAKSQMWERHSSSAQPPTRATYLDGTLQASLRTEHSTGDWNIQSNTQIAGSTNRMEALQYGTRGAQAARVDLGSYLVEATRGAQSPAATRLALGHVQAGDHPLLAHNIAHRGLVLHQRLGERLDLMMSAQSSTPLLGLQNITGVGRADNRYTLATLGWELLPRAGGLRLETTSFSGRTIAVAAPGISPPPAPASSRGWGLRLLAATEDNRWRGEFASALSDGAPQATGSTTAVPASRHRQGAYTLSLTRELLQQQPVWEARPDLPLSLAATLKRERAQPVYLSLGALTKPDSVSNSATLNAGLGPANAELQLISQENNLAPDPDRPRMRAPVVNLSFALPLGPLLNPQAPHAWWPTIDYRHERHRDYADPAFLPTGSTTDDLTDTMATTDRLGLNWALKTVTLGYIYSRTQQDNRQAVVAQQDTLITGHEFVATWNASETLSVNGGLGYTLGRQVRAEVLPEVQTRLDATTLVSALIPVKTRGHSTQAGLRWAWTARSALAASVSSRLTRDTPYASSLRELGGEISLSHGFDLSLAGAKLPAQWLLRYAHTRADARGVATPLTVPVQYQLFFASASLAF